MKESNRFQLIWASWDILSLSNVYHSTLYTAIPLYPENHYTSIHLYHSTLYNTVQNLGQTLFILKPSGQSIINDLFQCVTSNVKMRESFYFFIFF